jgi:microcystin-dependent protein
MLEPFIAAIVLFAGNFAPRGWAFCQGQILSIAQNTALFSLLGTTYGGNGQTTFALPDLRGRVPVGTGQGPGLPSINLGEVSGEPTHTLIVTEMPAHYHLLTVQAVSSAGNTNTPGSTASLAQLVDSRSNPLNVYSTAAANTIIAGGPSATSGGSQPHNNMQPYLGMNYIIALEGIYPSRN